MVLYNIHIFFFLFFTFCNRFGSAATRIVSPPVAVVRGMQPIHTSPSPLLHLSSLPSCMLVAVVVVLSVVVFGIVFGIVIVSLSYRYRIGIVSYRYRVGIVIGIAIISLSVSVSLSPSLSYRFRYRYWHRYRYRYRYGYRFVVGVVTVIGIEYLHRHRALCRVLGSGALAPWRDDTACTRVVGRRGFWSERSR